VLGSRALKPTVETRAGPLAMRAAIFAAFMIFSGARSSV
jgi:hypothetical protein